MNQLCTELLTKAHDRSGFQCGEDVLDDYLCRQASQDMKRHVAAVFVMVNEAEPKSILGYYTLASCAVETTGLPEDTRKKLPRYPSTPATLIGRLARSKDHPGLGSLLLADALKRIYQSINQVASALVIVDAKNDAAKAFYGKFGFLEFRGHPKKLFLPMKTVAQLMD